MNLAQLQSLPADKRSAVLASMSKADPASFGQLVEVLRKLDSTKERTKFYRMFPDSGPFRRQLYRHHMEFFSAGKWAQYRAFIGGNGTGKTEGGGFEFTAHLTGDYPAWWDGYDFNRPIRAWVGGDTAKTTRDIIQFKLFGTNDYRDADWGTGIIPADRIGKPNPSNQLAGLVDWVPVRHKSGRWSRLFLKSYEQGREAWQGPNIHLIWLDEQSPTDIYEESLSRFRGDSEDGRLMMTFTGLKGATDVALLFLPELTSITTESMAEASRFRVVCPMDDVPHLSKADVAKKLANYSGMARETRRTGIPYAGAGKIFTIDESAFLIDPIRVPDHWPLLTGADFGYGSAEDNSGGAPGGTAAVWGAWDRQADTIYVFDEYFRSQAEAPIHALALKKHGAWVPCEGDPAGVAINEGQRGKIIKIYRDLGLDIRPADKDVEAGLRAIEVRFAEGKLKVMRTCTGLINELRMYNRDDQGRIIKKNDHRVDSLRYMVMGIRHAKTKPIPKTSTYGTGSVDFGFTSRR